MFGTRNSLESVVEDAYDVADASEMLSSSTLGPLKLSRSSCGKEDATVVAITSLALSFPSSWMPELNR